MTKTRKLCYNTSQTVLYTLQLRYLLFSDVEKDRVTIVQLATYLFLSACYLLIEMPASTNHTPRQSNDEYLNTASGVFVVLHSALKMFRGFVFTRLLISMSYVIHRLKSNNHRQRYGTVFPRIIFVIYELGKVAISQQVL